MSIYSIYDLFNTQEELVAEYKKYFEDTTLSDDEIEKFATIAFYKIEPFFGYMRNYLIDEDTLRNYHVKRAVCYEANTVSMVGVDKQGVNVNTDDLGTVLSESFDGVSVSYKDTTNKGGEFVKNLLGLLSMDASILLSRYARKTFNMGTVCNV